ncbi:hypothetical protein [Yinghuangia seranimata]|uniref:hypothetical protein n=1 Tax=Yinghuangia seranimata TaxID=408067 RepID=UPI00248BC898|nr:hypothetical protein [Yinghuangia seranimata]MDI2129887.1 hypothetical protein [Yinghuangia seranimata]
MAQSTWHPRSWLRSSWLAGQWLPRSSRPDARHPAVRRAAVLAVAWLVMLLGLALMWHGLPAGGRGPAAWAVLGLLFTGGAGAGCLVLARATARDPEPGHRDELWAALAAVTAATGAAGVVALLVLEQVARFWQRLGLA